MDRLILLLIVWLITVALSLFIMAEIISDNVLDKQMTVKETRAEMPISSVKVIDYSDGSSEIVSPKATLAKNDRFGIPKLNWEDTKNEPKYSQSTEEKNAN